MMLKQLLSTDKIFEKVFSNSENFDWSSKTSENTWISKPTECILMVFLVRTSSREIPAADTLTAGPRECPTALRASQGRVVQGVSR